jgi:hypothetical protein
MSFFDESSLCLIPSGYKDQKLYAVKPLDGSGDLTFTRASSATRVASNGLIEKVRTNVILQSNTFGTTWTLDDATLTSGQSGYDGTSNAWLLAKTAAGGRVQQTLSLSSNSHTFSVYVKAGTKNWVFLRADGTSNRTSYFDLQNGVVGTASGCTASIVSAGNGWYRCSISYVDTTTSARIWVADADGDISGTSGNILIQAAQAELGDIATDYIATTTAAVSVGPVSGLPRLDYLGSSCPRLLLEPQRTNVIQNSENLNGANWTKTNCTTSVNVGTAPDGTASADKLIMNSGLSPTSAGADGIYQVGSITSGVYSVSFFVKAAEFSSVNVRDNAVTGAFLNINLTTGAVTNPAPSQFIGAQAVNYGNGWYRVSFTTDTIVATQAFSIRAGQTGDGTSGFLLWGVQYELGAYATSYIPTLGASVTRVADAAFKTGISSLIGQTEGTIFFEINSTNFESYTQRIFSISDDTNDNAIGFQLTGANEINYYVEVGGVLSALITKTAPAITLGQNVKVAAAYKANDFVLYVGGVQVGTDSSGGVPATSVLRYANPTGNAPYIGKVVQTLLFKTRLTNAQLAELTA